MSHDVVVIGAGAGGAALAWRLCEQGLRVLLLEAGPQFVPTKDYRVAQSDWERYLFPEPPGSRGDFTLAELDRLDPAHDALHSWNRVTGRLARGKVREVAGPGYWHVQGVGGTTLHFVGESHRLHPESMKLHSRYGVGCDWPMTYAELEPYYVVCENLIGVAGPTDQGPRWRSVPYPLPAHPLSPPARRLVAAGKRIGMHWQENSRAALSRAYDDRPPCNYCANCSRGCMIGDKGSADVTFIRKARASGHLDLKTGCRLVQIHAPAGRKIESVEYLQDGVLHRVETPRLVLAAGAVQTPRLLLSHRSRHHSRGLGNGSGQVGRNLMETLSWSSAGRVHDMFNGFVGLPSDAICWDFNAPDGIPGLVGGCRFNSGAQEVGFTGPINYASRVVSGFGSRLKEGVRQSFGSVISVGAIGEYLPNEGTYVDLDPVRRDAMNVPMPRLHFHLGAAEISRLHFMAKQARQLLSAAGAELVEEMGAWDQLSATHVFGTCRMGENADASVVNANCRSHEIDNLYITDASVFPSTGGGEAPSLTIQALAVRAADSITKE